MGHHSHLRLGHGRVFWNRDTYDPGLAALFTEEDRRYDDGRYGYYTTVGAMRQRLLVQGITATRAHADLDAGIEQWQQNKSPDEHVPSSTEELLHAYRTLITASEWDDIDQEEPWHILFYVDCRSILRLLVDMIPDDADVVLDLSELTGCCVELDPDKPIAQIERADQLARVAVDAPLIVLTEGRSDSRLLSLAMKITHPHLVGFINFIDFEGTHGAEGGVGALARMVYSFVAAGVANRFVAIADNDTMAHDALKKVKTDRSLPSRCRVIHYPDLPILARYPTLGPYSSETQLADINGRAGALEMYLGLDTLTINGQLAPVQWTSYSPSLGRYQGSLLSRDKEVVHQAFLAKIKRAEQEGADAAEMDWTGVHRIIDCIVHAFD